MYPIRLLTLTEVARLLRRDPRGLKKIAKTVQPVASAMIGGREVGLYRADQFKPDQNYDAQRTRTGACLGENQALTK
jgi:hypothetical protein